MLKPIFGLAVWTLMTVPSVGECEDSTTEERAAQLVVMQQSLREYKLTIGALAKPVELRETPVLRFTNPIRGAKDGGLFLWEYAGRPVAMTCIYSFDIKHWDHEFQTVSDLQLTAIRADRIAWQPPAAPAFKEVPRTEAPSATSSARRREMGSLSRRFSANLLGWGEGQPKNDELRLQVNPVHRWGGGDSPVVDGAMFLYGEATDPELALLIEAHQAGEMRVWKYAVARLTSGELVVRLDSQNLMTIPVWDQNPRANQPYLTLFNQTSSFAK